MTVVHSVPFWLPQTQTWLHTQIRHLPANIHSHIVCERTENLDQFGLPNITDLSQVTIWERFYLKMQRALTGRRRGYPVEKQALRCGAQVLHSHFGNMGWLNLAACQAAQLKHVVTFYGLDVGYLPRLDRRWLDRYQALFEQVDHVLCEGPHMANCVRELGCPPDKVEIHHLGVRVADIPFRPRAWDGRAPLRILLASAFREKKGLPFALEALGKLQQQLPVEITIIGDASTSDPRSLQEKERIFATLAREGLDDKVRLLGYQPHSVFFDESYQHHVFLSPSITASDGDTEGGAPVSIIEMAASGIPVISTTHCDIPAIIQDRVTGLLAPERDVYGLLKQLLWLVENRNEWASLLTSARKHVESEFSACTQGERLAGIYLRLIDPSKGRTEQTATP
jgi:colanic acid/amylovoran biosynthesis glycosyltransferase